MHRVATLPALDAPTLARALAQLHAAVRARGLKRSAVRDAIARAALQYPGHFTAEDLLTALRSHGAPEVHPATVYRVLPLLVEAGLIQEALRASGQGQRYERAFERAHHDHVICTGCGSVIEFELEEFERLQREVAAHFGFVLTGHVHELYGLCARCQAAR